MFSGGTLSCGGVDQRCRLVDRSGEQDQGARGRANVGASGGSHGRQRLDRYQSAFSRRPRRAVVVGHGTTTWRGSPAVMQLGVVEWMSTCIMEPTQAQCPCTTDTHPPKQKHTHKHTLTHTHQERDCASLRPCGLGVFAESWSVGPWVEGLGRGLQDDGWLHKWRRRASGGGHCGGVGRLDLHHQPGVGIATGAGGQGRPPPPPPGASWRCTPRKGIGRS